MQNYILVINDELKLNHNFFLYLLNLYIQKFGGVDKIEFIEKNDVNIPNLITNLSQEEMNLTIFASNSNYHLISKIIATISQDFLDYKSFQTLAPSKAERVEKNSFLIKLNNAYINVLKIDPLQDIPYFLIKHQKDFKDFYVFNYDIAQLKQILEPLYTMFNVTITISKYSQFITMVRVYQNEYGDVEQFIKEARFTLNNRVILNSNFIEFIVKKLKENRAKITFAESCTAGLAAATLCNISGSSEVFNGSLVTYSNEIKNLWLSVDNDVLNTKGAVSKECVSQMIDGAIESSGASFAMAISGIAGPSGGSKEKPVGTVFIGVGQNGGSKIVEEFHISGDRTCVRKESVNIAFSLLLMLKEDLFFS